MEAIRHHVSQDTPEQAAIRAKRGFLCNWTGGHCPRGCADPCGYTIDKTLCGGVIETQDYNLGTEFAALSKAQEPSARRALAKALR
jgi:hypothetical protein